MQLIEDENKKIVKSLRYNYIFDKNNGFFARWGVTKEDDPEFSPFGPEIADIEISSANAEDVQNTNSSMIITEGGCSGGCRFCYKGSKPLIMFKIEYDNGEICDYYEDDEFITTNGIKKAKDLSVYDVIL